jgi:predicted nucleotidyltransferase
LPEPDRRDSAVARKGPGDNSSDPDCISFLCSDILEGHVRRELKAEMQADYIRDVLYPVFEKYRDKVEFAYVFGSAAGKEVYPLSDIDIAVYISQFAGAYLTDLRLDIYADLCRTLRRNDVDLVILNTAKNLILLDNITRQGIVIFERNSALREEFELRVQHQAIDFRTQRRAILGV